MAELAALFDAATNPYLKKNAGKPKAPVIDKPKVTHEAPAPKPAAKPTEKRKRDAAQDGDEAEERDGGKLARTVFVGNVPVSATRKEIKRAFATYGRVESVRVRSLPVAETTKAPRRAVAITREGLDDKRSSMNAYVCFADATGAAAALAHNMQEL